MQRRLLVLLWIGGLSFGQIRAPQLGFVRNANGQITPVSGLADCFVIGKALAIQGVSSSFSGQAGVVLQQGRTVVLNASGGVVAAFPEGDVNGKTGISAGIDTAIAWLPATRKVVWFDGSQFQSQELPAALPGTVLSIRRNGKQAFLLLEENGGAVSQGTVSLTNGNLLNIALLLGRTAPATYLDTQVLSSEQLDGVPCSAASIEPMSPSWAHVSCSDGRQWVIHMNGVQARASELPGSQIRKLDTGSTQERRQ